LLPEYLSYYTSSSIYDNWKNCIFIQATIPNIGAEKYGMLQIPLPSVDEQRMIIGYLDKEVKKIMTAIGDCKRQISLLQERKQILINEVVIGKVQVV
jgi:type I restriction enzyme S subunit